MAILFLLGAFLFPGSSLAKIDLPPGPELGVKEKKDNSYISFQNGHLTVKLESTPLKEVLSKLADKTGINILIFGSIDREVNIEFVNSLLDDALRRILSHEDTIFIYSRSKSEDGQGYITKLTEVYVGKNRQGQSTPQVITPSRGYSPVQPATGILKSHEVAVETIVHILNDEEDEDIRDSMVEALGRIGGEKVVGPLLQALSDEDSWVRESAVEALGRIKSSQAIRPLRKIVDDPEEDEDVIETAKEVLEQLLRQEQ